MAKKELENDYRSERKERLSKSAKQKSKKKHDSTDIIAGVIKALCVVVVIALICGVVYAFGVPQKLMPALKVGDRTYSAAEYSYYYTSVYQTYANNSYSQVNQYGVNLSGFDYTKDPADQTTKDDDGNTITYDEFFRNYVVETLENYNHYLTLAKEQNIELSDEHKQEIDENIEELAKYASDYGYSTSRYISVLYGKGLNEKMLRSLLEDQFLVSQMIEDEEEDIKKDITQDDIQQVFDEDPGAYQSVDIRLLGIAIDKEEETESETETNAETQPAESNEAAENASEQETAEESEAAVSEENESESESAAAADAETEAPETNEAESADEETTEENKEPSKAEKLANEMLAEVTDEESFIELCKKYCAEDQKETFEDESASLFKGIKKSTVSSNIDEELADWLFDSERKVGDKRVFVADDYAYVIYMKSTAYTEEDPLVSARHILISFSDIAAELASEEADNAEAAVETETEENAAQDTETTTEAPEEKEVEVKEVTASDGTVISNEGTSYTAEVILKAYEKAKEIYEEYMDGAKTEESFAELAEKYSADTASLKNEDDADAEGGLYKDITKGQMVKPFEDWVYDDARQPGDVGLVMTTYGWHVMYFVSSHDEPQWVETIRDSIVKEKTEAKQEELSQQVAGTAETTAFTKFAGNEALKLVNKLYVNGRS